MCLWVFPASEVIFSLVHKSHGHFQQLIIIYLCPISFLSSSLSSATKLVMTMKVATMAMVVMAIVAIIIVTVVMMVMVVLLAIVGAKEMTVSSVMRAVPATNVNHLFPPFISIRNIYIGIFFVGKFVFG